MIRDCLLTRLSHKPGWVIIWGQQKAKWVQQKAGVCIICRALLSSLCQGLIPCNVIWKLCHQKKKELQWKFGRGLTKFSPGWGGGGTVLRWTRWTRWTKWTRWQNSLPEKIHNSVTLKPFSRENGRFWDLSDLPQNFGKAKNNVYPCLRFSTMDVRQSRLVPTNRPLALLPSFAEKLTF